MNTNEKSKEEKRKKKMEKRLQQQKRREERERLEREKLEEDCRKIFEKIGVDDLDDFYEVVYESGEDVAYRELGFETRDGAYEGFIGEAEPSSARIVKYHNCYILCVESEMTHGTSELLIYDTQVFDTEEEAISSLNSLPYGYRSLRDIIHEIKEDLNDPNVWIDVKYEPYSGYYFNLKYDYDPVLEKYYELDAETVREAIKHYEEFKDKCKKHGYELVNVYKMPREWNDNQRYYCFEFANSDGLVEKKVHIPSAMQHRSRVVCDLCTRKILNEVEDEFEELAEEYRPIKEYEQKRREEKDEYEKNHEILNLSKDEVTELAEYVERKLHEEECNGTLRFAREWLHSKYNDSEKELSAEVFLEQHGGFCDCEIPYNVVNQI